MKRLLFTAALFATAILTGHAQEQSTTEPETPQKSYIYRIALSDKKGSIDLSKPEKFLSKKALERRKKQMLTLDETDRPVSPKYIKKINTSSWHQPMAEHRPCEGNRHDCYQQNM